MAPNLRVNPITCEGHGLCAELLPELIRLDDWGYPILEAGPIPERLLPLAKRAANACPTLALLLQEAPARALAPVRSATAPVRHSEYRSEPAASPARHRTTGERAAQTAG